MPPEQTTEKHNTGAFRSLRIFNYRLWASGAIISNIGTWMQRTAQDWLVLTELSHHNASAVGTVMALQFLPVLVLFPFTGPAADRFNRRKMLMLTQACMGTLALCLGLLTISGMVQLWHVYTFAFLFGCVVAFDTPARQTFVSDMVTDADLPNAVGLNSTSFNSARLIGPAIAGVLIAHVGCGWMFVLNGLSFVAVLFSLMLLRQNELNQRDRSERGRGSLQECFAYLRGKPDLIAVLIMLFLIGTFGINFAIFISTMSAVVFQSGPRIYGLLTSMMAIGSVSGAFSSARNAKPGMKRLCFASAAFGLGFTLAIFTPTYWAFGLTLILIGAASQTFTTTANSTVQLSTAAGMRGRVLSIFFAIAMGGTPLGAPLVGFIADRFGPRIALTVGAAAGFSALAVGLFFLFVYQKRTREPALE